MRVTIGIFPSLEPAPLQGHRSAIAVQSCAGIRLGLRDLLNDEKCFCTVMTRIRIHERHDLSKKRPFYPRLGEDARYPFSPQGRIPPKKNSTGARDKPVAVGTIDPRHPHTGTRTLAMSECSVFMSVSSSFIHH
jgi:hypothetical protein